MYFPPGFDPTLACEQANLVQQAYNQYFAWRKGQAWELPAPYSLLSTLSATPHWIPVVEPFGFVAGKAGTKNAYVVFRGTESWDDWIADFTFPQVKHPWGAVEDGFWNIYKQCSKAVLNGVGKVPGAAVLCSGHSLGGALAILSAADVILNGLPAPTMYTLAGPRTGNIDFAKQFDAKCQNAYRIVNTEDIVPDQPMATPNILLIQAVLAKVKLLAPVALLMTQHFGSLLNYQHVGYPVDFTDNRGSIADNHILKTYLRNLGG